MRHPLLKPVGTTPSFLQRLRLALTRPHFSPFIEPPLPDSIEPPLAPQPFRFAEPAPKRVEPPEPILPQTAAEMAPYLALSPKTPWAIRAAGEFVATAPDLRGQVIELIDHLFVRYPVPLFLYRVMLSEAGLRLVFPNEPHGHMQKTRLQKEAHLRRWFYAVAWGEPCAALAKDVLSKREAHWFLQAPAHNGVETNLRWARVAALGVPSEACDFFLQKFSYHLDTLTDERKMDLAWFYARTWSEMRVHERDEIADYVRSTLNDADFSLAGRTAASVRRLSEAWHRRFEGHGFPRFEHLERKVSWRASLQPWEERFGMVVVRAVELTNSRELEDEGARQHHCVASYAVKCHQNRSRIASLRWFDARTAEEIARLTVEVDLDRRRVVQIRGRRNRRAEPEELDVVRRWVEAHGLTIGAYA